METVGTGEGPQVHRSAHPTLAPAQAEQVVQFLLARNYYATALELLVESQASGREQDVMELQVFFSDRDKFPPLEVAKFQASNAMDVAQVSREREARLQLVEHELHVTQEDLAEARAALAAAGGGPAAAAAALLANGHASSPSVSSSSQQRSLAGDSQLDADQFGLPSAPPTAAELSAVNAAVLGYLVRHGHKMSALTFRDEAAVGNGSSAKPLALNAAAGRDSLWSWFRLAQQGGAPGSSEQLAHQRANQLAAELTAAQAALSDAQQQCAAYGALVEKYQRLLSHPDGGLQGTNTANGANGTRPGEPGAGGGGFLYLPALSGGEGGGPLSLGGAPGVQMMAGGDGAAARSSDAGGGGGGAAAVDPQAAQMRSIVGTLIGLLPGLVPSLASKGRLELLPLLKALVAAHTSEPETQRRLLSTVFNLFNNPNPEQRKQIVAACTDMCVSYGVPWATHEMLPLAGRAVSSPSPERRTLLAELLVALMPIVDMASAAGGLLTVLQRLLDDRWQPVREAALAGLVALLQHLPYSSAISATLQEAVIKLSQDGSHDVVDLVLKSLLPAVLAWSGPAQADTVASLLPKALATATQHVLTVVAAQNQFLSDDPLFAGSAAAAAAGHRRTPSSGTATPSLAPLSGGGSQLTHSSMRGLLAAEFCTVGRLLGLYQALLPDLQAVALRGCPSWVRTTASKATAVADHSKLPPHALYEAWAQHAGSTPPGGGKPLAEWDAVKWFFTRLLADFFALVRVIPVAPPAGDESLALRQRCGAVLQAMADMIGPVATRLVLMPLTACAAAAGVCEGEGAVPPPAGAASPQPGSPDRPNGGSSSSSSSAAAGAASSFKGITLPDLVWRDVPAPMRNFALKAVPQVPEAIAASRAALLPQLLGILLPATGGFLPFVQSLLSMTLPSGVTWVVLNRASVAGALQFAVHCDGAKAALPGLMEEVLAGVSGRGAAAPTVQQQLGAVVVMQAVSGGASDQLMRTRLLPGLMTMLLGAEEDAVGAAVVSALGGLVLGRFADDARALEQVFTLLDTAVMLEPLDPAALAGGGAAGAPGGAGSMRMAAAMESVRRQHLTLMALLNFCGQLSTAVCPRVASQPRAASQLEWALTKTNAAILAKLEPPRGLLSSGSGAPPPSAQQVEEQRQVAAVVVQVLAVVHAAGVQLPKVEALMQGNLEALAARKHLLTPSAAEQCAQMLRARASWQKTFSSLQQQATALVNSAQTAIQSASSSAPSAAAAAAADGHVAASTITSGGGGGGSGPSDGGAGAGSRPTAGAASAAGSGSASSGVPPSITLTTHLVYQPIQPSQHQQQQQHPGGSSSSEPESPAASEAPASSAAAPATTRFAQYTASTLAAFGYKSDAPPAGAASGGAPAAGASAATGGPAPAGAAAAAAPSSLAAQLDAAKAAEAAKKFGEKVSQLWHSSLSSTTTTTGSGSGSSSSTMARKADS